jgi:hypothetical protein
VTVRLKLLLKKIHVLQRFPNTLRFTIWSKTQTVTGNPLPARMVQNRAVCQLLVPVLCSSSDIMIPRQLLRQKTTCPQAVPAFRDTQAKVTWDQPSPAFPPINGLHLPILSLAIKIRINSPTPSVLKAHTPMSDVQYPKIIQRIPTITRRIT